MLTKSDLQAIEKMIDHGNNALRVDLDASIDKKLEPLKKNIRKIRKGIDKVIDYFDQREVHLQKRVKTIEDHLGFPPQQN